MQQRKQSVQGWLTSCGEAKHQKKQYVQGWLASCGKAKHGTAALLCAAGRYKDACELCANAGQSWRAVSLAGAGTWGPLPVGDAALKASQGADTQVGLAHFACFELGASGTVFEEQERHASVFTISVYTVSTVSQCVLCQLLHVRATVRLTDGQPPAQPALPQPGQPVSSLGLHP